MKISPLAGKPAEPSLLVDESAIHIHLTASLDHVSSSGYSVLYTIVCTKSNNDKKKLYRIEKTVKRLVSKVVF